MNSKKFNLGFTLIELLVVIAIIGILSSIVLVSLGTARKKGQVAAAKGELTDIRNQAELVYSTDGDYDSACAGAGPVTIAKGLTVVPSSPTNANVQKTLLSISKRGFFTSIGCDAASGAQTWAAAISDVSTLDPVFCIDSSGSVGTYNMTNGGSCAISGSP